MCSRVKCWFCWYVHNVVTQKCLFCILRSWTITKACPLLVHKFLSPKMLAVPSDLCLPINLCGFQRHLMIITSHTCSLISRCVVMSTTDWHNQKCQPGCHSAMTDVYELLHCTVLWHSSVCIGCVCPGCHITEERKEGRQIAGILKVCTEHCALGNWLVKWFVAFPTMN